MKKTLIAAAIVAAGQPLSSAAGELEQMTVTASRIEIPKAQVGVSVSVLTAADIERLGYTSLLDVIRTLPGISVSNSGGAGKVSSVYLRGESNFRTLVLLDGVNIADPAAPQVGAQFQHLQSADIERIEVLRGPQGMMYGAGAGGVINIISKKAGEPLRIQLGAETGRYGARRGSASLGGSHAGWDYNLSLAGFSNDGFNSRESDNSGERDGYDNLAGSARLGFQFSDEFSVAGQLRHTAAESEYDGCFDASFMPSNTCEDQFAQSSYRLAGNYRQGSTDHEFAVARQEIERDTIVAGQSGFAVDGAVAELNYVASAAPAGGRLLWGGEYEQQEFNSDFSEHDIDSLGLFTEWRGDLAEKFFYSLGYRRDRLETEDHNSWRASAAYPVLLGEQQRLKYRASYGTGYRAPSPFEISLNLAEGVAAVGPETSRGYELGFEYQLARLMQRELGLQLELVYFDQEINDAIIYDFSLGSWGAYGQDDGGSHSEGVELSLAGKLGDSGDWYLNGTWLDAVDTAGRQRLQVPQRVYNLGLSYYLFGDRLMLSGNWQQVEDRLDISGEVLDDYGKLDLNAEYRLTQQMRLTLRGENLLDEDYREVAGFNTAGAAVYAGLQLTL